ncbi:MAG: hypothetical protein K9J37_08950 [Saprospiraceae bacterium]|nr:hypothetical protein [Saprospiraceae bacterium]MCF8250029.1 hypothetical protein [Saprospiraceae bacterium]MCF8278931.1 hypothetical protein [Bacteroidales bacterium]MCF8311042.1 hypothetical protein [Saprospiraceae bacterium]MCF8439622.1 hypothetical protein [Saprospiraceae bacterium]
MKKNSFLLVFGLISIAFLFGSCNNEAKQNPAMSSQVQTDSIAISCETASAAQPPAQSVGLDADSIVKLPCGKKIKFKENGLEAKLLAQIEDKAMAVGKLPWLDFDIVAFDAGTSKLVMPQSVGQLSNLAQIVSCFPNARFKIAANLVPGQNELSTLDKERITVIKATLIGLGVSPSNLESGISGLSKNTVSDGKTENNITLQLLAK